MDTKEIKDVIESFIKALGVSFEEVVIDTTEGKTPTFILKTKEAPLLIGTRGVHFQALSSLIKRIIETRAQQKGVVEPKFFIDVNDYRAGITKQLLTKATILAERARSLKADIEMEPMTAYDRLVVHEHLSHVPHIKTESIGDGKQRRIMIRYKEESRVEEVF